MEGVDPMIGNYGEQVRLGLPIFNQEAFSNPDVANFRFGNAARTYNDIRRDNYKNVDLSIIKNIKFDEVRKIQLRAEFLNAFNTVVFGAPVVTFGNANFGNYANQDVALGNRPRVIQLVGRFTF